MDSKLKESVRQYATSVIRAMPLNNIKHLEAMVILHFDIPDADAEKLVWENIVMLVHQLDMDGTELLTALSEAGNQIEYLQNKFQETGASNQVLAKIKNIEDKHRSAK